MAHSCRFVFWLKEGENHFGSAGTNQIVLPADAPSLAGSFELKEGKVRLQMSPGVASLLNGKPGVPRELRSDNAEFPDMLSLGDVSMQVIERGKRLAIRLWDNSSPARRQFPGVSWFPGQDEYRIIADFCSYPEPRMIPIVDVLGNTESDSSPGYAAFRIRGKEYRLAPITEDNRLFFIFHDLTSGKQTYPAGRFLYAEQPKDGKVVLDFNTAHNPPCAYTSFATCPLPPKENFLNVRIEAGELNYKSSSHSK